MVNTIWKENFLIMCSKLCLNARDSGHFAQLLLICRNYSLQTLCGAPHNVCHEENELKKQQKTAIITLDNSDLITSYEEKPKEPKGNLAVPPFYCYRACDVKRIQEALENGCGYDAPGSFAAWLSKQTPMHAYVMPGKRYDIGDINSYEYVKSVFSK